MQKANALLLSLIIIFASFAGCGKKDEHIGSWFTEKNGVGMTVTFNDNGTMEIFCKIADKKTADALGVNEDIVQAKNVTCLYDVDKNPDLSSFGGNVPKVIEGKLALNRYLSAEDMKNNRVAETIYFMVSGDTLVTYQPSVQYDKMSDTPIYSETVFKRR
ncbi:MAG: hypothetical protein IJC89_06125 [Clostridia bacterium]|nr:hypothetical protein [Clostridia bacterium]